MIDFIVDIALGLQVPADLAHVGDVPLVEMKSRLRVRLEIVLAQAQWRVEAARKTGEH